MRGNNQGAGAATRWFGLLFLAAAGVGIACSGNSSADSAALFRTNLDGMRTLDSLSAAEGAAYCEEFAAGMDRMSTSPEAVEGACRLRGRMAASGAGASDDGQVCEATKSACKEELATKEAPAGCPVAFPTTCTATIDELNTCWNAIAAFFDSFAVTVRDCGNADEVDEEASQAARMALEMGCRPYHDRCPPTPP